MPNLDNKIFLVNSICFKLHSESNYPILFAIIATETYSEVLFVKLKIAIKAPGELQKNGPVELFLNIPDDTEEEFQYLFP